MLEGAREFQIKVTCFAVGSAAAPVCVVHRNQLLYFFSFMWRKGKIHPEQKFHCASQIFFRQLSHSPR